MPVVYEGVELHFSDAVDDTAYTMSVTVNANATCIVVGTAYAGSQTNRGLSTVKLDNGAGADQDFTVDANADDSASYDQAGIAHLFSPATTGANTITVALLGAQDYDRDYYVAYFSSVDTGGIRGSSAFAQQNSASKTCTNTAADCLVVCAANDAAINWTNTTAEIATSVPDGIGEGSLAYLISDGENETISFSNNNSGYVGIALIPYSGGPYTGTGALSSQSTVLGGAGTLYAYQAYGYGSPQGWEVPVSWTTWHLGTGAGVSGGGYGDLIIPKGVTCDGPVADMGCVATREISLTTKYGANSGSYTRYIRGSDTLFAWSDGAPAWTPYVAPVTQAWRYLQARIVGG
jgi:hypothetical protein